MIARIDSWQQALRMGWIAGDLVKIDHRIEVSGSSDPFIDGLPIGFTGRTGMIVVESDEGHYGRAQDLDVMGVSARDHLLIRADDSVDDRIVLRAGNLAISRQHTKIVNSFKNDEVADPWLGNHIMVEAG